MDLDGYQLRLSKLGEVYYESFPQRSLTWEQNRPCLDATLPR
jgi:hypothetical protein